MKNISSGFLAGFFLLVTTILPIGLYSSEGNKPGLTDDNVKVWWSSELLPGSMLWYTNPSKPEDITYKLTRRADIKWKCFRNDFALTFHLLLKRETINLIGM